MADEKQNKYFFDKAIKTIDFIFGEYKDIFDKTGLIDIHIPHYLNPEQRDIIKKYYEGKDSFVRVEPMVNSDPEEVIDGHWRSTTSFKFRKNN